MSGSTTLMSLRITAIGAAKTFPRPRAVTWTWSAEESLMLTSWCFVLGAAVTDSSPSWISYRRPSLGSAA